eukprot:gene4481-14642_t
MVTPERDSLSTLAPQWFKRGSYAPSFTRPVGSSFVKEAEVNVASVAPSQFVALGSVTAVHDTITTTSGSGGGSIGSRPPRRFVDSSAMAIPGGGNRVKASLTDRPWTPPVPAPTPNSTASIATDNSMGESIVRHKSWGASVASSQMPAGRTRMTNGRLSDDEPLQMQFSADGSYSRPAPAVNRSASLGDSAPSVPRWMSADLDAAPEPGYLQTSVAGYQKVVFEKEYPSLKNSKNPFGYSPREAPYKQNFLASCPTTNWTSKLAEPIPPASGDPDAELAAASSAPASAVSLELKAAALAAVTEGQLHSATSSATSTHHVGWFSVASSATGGGQAGRPGGEEGLPNTERLREQLAMRQSKQLVPMMAKKEDPKKSVNTRGGVRLVPPAKVPGPLPLSAAPESGKPLRPGMAALTNGSLTTKVATKLGLDKPCTGPRAPLNAPPSGLVNLAKPAGGHGRVFQGKKVRTETGNSVNSATSVTPTTSANSPPAPGTTSAPSSVISPTATDPSPADLGQTVSQHTDSQPAEEKIRAFQQQYPPTTHPTNTPPPGFEALALATPMC